MHTILEAISQYVEQSNFNEGAEGLRLSPAAVGFLAGMSYGSSQWGEARLMLDRLRSGAPGYIPFPDDECARFFRAAGVSPASYTPDA